MTSLSTTSRPDLARRRRRCRRPSSRRRARRPSSAPTARTRTAGSAPPPIVCMSKKNALVMFFDDLADDERRRSSGSRCAARCRRRPGRPRRPPPGCCAAPGIGAPLSCLRRLAGNGRQHRRRARGRRACRRGSCSPARPTAAAAPGSPRSRPARAGISRPAARHQLVDQPDLQRLAPACAAAPAAAPSCSASAMPSIRVIRDPPPPPGSRPSVTSGSPNDAPGRVERDAVVAGQRDLEAAAERGAVDRRDHRPAERLQPAQLRP